MMVRSIVLVASVLFSTLAWAEPIDMKRRPASDEPPPCAEERGQEHPWVCVEPVRVDSGIVNNFSDEEAVVFEDTVQIDWPGRDDIPWIAIRIAPETVLPSGGTIRFTSLDDGEVDSVHYFELQEMREQGAALPHVSGSSFKVELLLPQFHPRFPDSSTGARLVIEEVVVGGLSGTPESEIPDFPLTPFSDLLAGIGTKDICGTSDNRVPSDNKAVGRLLTQSSTGGCTGYFIKVAKDGSNACLLSAGHCFDSAGQVSRIAQFDVPNSSATCTLAAPSGSDRFDVDTFAIDYRFTGVGNDWAVFRLKRNTTTGKTASKEQGATLSLHSGALPSTGTVRVTGYGDDGNAGASGGSNSACSTCTAGQRDQTQQTSTGSLTSSTQNRIDHQVDTCGGNSGSPIFLESAGKVIGIHTNGGCTSGSNSGTAITNSALAVAIAECGRKQALMLMDRTGSMLVSRASGKTRCEDALTVAKQDIEKFFADHPDGRMAVWSFAGSSASALTSGYVGKAAALAAINALSPTGCSGSTPLAEAMCDAANSLATSGGLRERHLYVSTDGEENNSSGECAGFYSSSTTPPYTSGSWQNKVYLKLRERSVVLARLWGGFSTSAASQLATHDGEGVDPETGEIRVKGFVSDTQFFQDLSASTDGAAQVVDDSGPLPTAIQPAPVFADGFEGGNTSAWSQTID